MSRTRRRDEEGNVFWEGRLTPEVNHRCRCEHCVSAPKKRKEEIWQDSKIKEGIKIMHEGP